VDVSWLGHVFRISEWISREVFDGTGKRGTRKKFNRRKMVPEKIEPEKIEPEKNRTGKR